jgi:hypothetical protein
VLSCGLNSCPSIRSPQHAEHRIVPSRHIPVANEPRTGRGPWTLRTPISVRRSPGIRLGRTRSCSR